MTQQVTDITLCISYDAEGVSNHDERACCIEHSNRFTPVHLQLGSSDRLLMHRLVKAHGYRDEESEEEKLEHETTT